MIKERDLPTLEEALAAVRQKSLSTVPVAGLFWLALMQTMDLNVSDLEAKLFLDLARELSTADTAGQRHHTFSGPEIDVLLAGFPTAMSLPGFTTLKDQTVFWLEPLGVDIGGFGRRGCHGIGGGSLRIDAQVQGWSPLGLALRARHLDSEIDQLDPDWAHPRVREFQSMLSMNWVKDELLDYPLACSASSDAEWPRRGLRDPLGLWSPAYKDAAGRTHDAFDFLSERMVADGVAWLTRLAIEGAGPDAGATLAGRYAARLHDLAVDDYRSLRDCQNCDGQGGDLPICADSPVHRSLGRMIDAGAHLTAAQWGGGRTFGARLGAVDDMGLVSCLFSDQPGMWNDDKRLAALRRLQDLGHDVVVAHVNEDHRSRSFSMLPLYDCLGADHPGCVAQLLDWGADEKASVHNFNEGGTTLALAESIEADFPDRLAPGVLRAALARRQALRVLDDLGMADPGRGGP